MVFYLHRFECAPDVERSGLDGSAVSTVADALVEGIFWYLGVQMARSRDLIGVVFCGFASQSVSNAW